MRFMNWHKLTLAAAGLAWTAALATSALAATATVSFQNGIGTYTGTYDRKIDERPDPAAPAAPLTYDGSTQTQYFLDGYNGTSNPTSPDGQAMIKFNNIIGNGPGQIPPNAYILSAELQVTTSTSGNAQSAGPWGVAQLLQPFDSNTTYFGSFNCGCALTSRGPWFEDGYTERPLAGFGSNWQGEVTSNNITSMVQNWVNDSTKNHGLVIQTGNPRGTDDGWGVLSTGHPLPERRPRLSVTYTTNPMEVNSFQRGVAGYTGDTMAYVRSGTNIVGTTTEADSARDDITFDALTGAHSVASNTTIAAPADLTLFEQFLDGAQFESPTGVANSADQLALLKFGGVFGAGAGQAPSDVPVAKAWVVITTSVQDPGLASMTNGEWAAHQVLRPWSTNTLHSDFGDIPGLQETDGDIGPALDVQEGIIYGSEVWFEVTSYMNAVRLGGTDNGLAILSNSTADGWQIHLNGSTDPESRPRLHMISGIVPIVSPSLPGDFNGNGTVDAADYSTWRDHLGGTHNLNGNGDETGGSGGLVDQADYNLWKANFGNSGSGGSLGSSAVPEPGTLALLALASMGLVITGRRK
jgi:hypothetical protein